MNLEEKMEHEALKNLIKAMICRNDQLTQVQKQVAMDNVDVAAQGADWFIEILRACGYIKQQCWLHKIGEVVNQ